MAVAQGPGGERSARSVPLGHGEGIWFENLYATGTRSVRGIEAVTTGFLPTPGRSVVKLGSYGKRFFNMGGYLKQFGFQSLFVYGGESNFDNMRGFLLDNGFDRVVDAKDFEDNV
jgi:phosphoglycerol transferase MdoB-like AlkP superfamily enzyme